MDIILIACNRKRELLSRFCIAYNAILSQHSIFTMSDISHLISQAIRIKPVEYLNSSFGGFQQIYSKISCNEADLVIFFRENTTASDDSGELDVVLRLCDFYNVPMATNVATAEVLIHGLARGDFDWRKIGNPVV